MSLLWCTEALPLYVTAMLVPLLAVVLRVMVDSSGSAPVRLSAEDAAPAVFKAMFSQARPWVQGACLQSMFSPVAAGRVTTTQPPASLHSCLPMIGMAMLFQAQTDCSTHRMCCVSGVPLVPLHHRSAALPACGSLGTLQLKAPQSCAFLSWSEPSPKGPSGCAMLCFQVIMLLLGGFAIAAALSKHALAKRGATWILARVGGRPATVLLTNMLVGAPVLLTNMLVGAPVLLTNMLVGAPAKASRLLLVACGVRDGHGSAEVPGT